MKYLTVTCLSALLLLTCQLSAARVLTIAESINKAGQQRMLSQRISKNYLAVANRIFTSDSKAELNGSIEMFERNLTNLGESVVDENSKNALTKLQDKWQVFHQIITTQPNKENTNKILEENTKLLTVAHSLVVSLENYANKSGAKLVNISGRQRMLSQRITLYYFASYAGYRGDSHHQHLNTAVEEFDKALSILLKSEENTKEIADSLKDVHRQWEFYKPKFEKVGTDRYVPRIIRIITENILKDMDKITNLYERNL